jgi:hypothetical protein
MRSASTHRRATLRLSSSVFGVRIVFPGPLQRVELIGHVS